MHATPPGRIQASLGALRNEPSLLLGKRCINVQHEGIRVGPEFGHNEGGPMLHQPADEMNVAAETV